jgi:transketolase
LEKRLSTPYDLITKTVKSLALSAVEKAKSGHTSFPLGMADVGYTLFFNHMKYHPDHPDWLNRDRLVLSSGHGSMFLYAFLHIMGYKVSLDDIKNFRQLDSITPGHPEFGMTEGVECTTGPLGQGISNAVGMALAEQMLAAQYNTEHHSVFDHYTYCLCGDGDLMEGVAMEAISFAGSHRLKKLICIYDYNEITIDGKTDITYHDDVRKKMEAQHWNVTEIDGHDIVQIDNAINDAKTSDRPTMIIAKTISGKGAHNWEGTHQIHGNPMKPDDYDESFKALGIDRFTVPNDVYENASQRRDALSNDFDRWTSMYHDWMREHEDLGERLKKITEHDHADLLDSIDKIECSKDAATRKINGQILNIVTQYDHSLVGGSADLAGSNNTTLAQSTFVSKDDFSGRNIHFGVREHAMGGIMNGMAYHGILRPYGGTFLVFSDYMRPSVRLAALSHLNPIYIWTHDAFYVGEDGPTHHPVEHVSALRLIPNLVDIRPADEYELKSAWKYIIQTQDRPVGLCLTRQNVATIERDDYNPAQVEKGAYILHDCVDPKFIIAASGSEVSLVLDTIKDMDIRNQTRIVSVPSMTLFNEQSEDYKQSVFPKSVSKIMSVEAGSTDLWYRYVNHAFGKDSFSKSAPYGDLAEDFGFVPEKLKIEIEKYLAE